jgi:hypothetical protein
MQTRIASITVDDMADPDFSEAANYLAFAWRERPDLRSALATRNWATMADPRSWPKDESAVGALRLILHIARSEIIPEHEAQRLQREIVSSLDRDACANTRTLPLFLLLWNLAAVRYERGENRSFDQMFPDAFIETLLEVLKERVQATGDNSEKVAQLALGGLLVFLVATLRKRILRILAPLAKSASWLKQEALERTFVPAFFALEGVALLTTSASVFTPQVCFGLLWKSGDYGDVGPAIEHLRKRLKR